MLAVVHARPEGVRVQADQAAHRLEAILGERPGALAVLVGIEHVVVGPELALVGGAPGGYAANYAPPAPDATAAKATVAAPVEPRS